MDTRSRGSSHGRYRNGQSLVDEFISERYSLDQINEGYADMLKARHQRAALIID